ncbi:hypothetical protein NL676_036466 [Syzygium grande]|nr:hypothetical protein NL676_036466 [Syzygium grande]
MAPTGSSPIYPSVRHQSRNLCISTREATSFGFNACPCSACFKQSPPLFDPAKSSTYSNIRCRSIACVLSGDKCDPNNEYCIYERSYFDTTTTAGNLASDQATFETSDEGTVKVPIQVFGCGHVNKDTAEGQESGLLGLGVGDGNLPDLVKQFGSKFSYCIGNIHDPQYQYNHLILGDGAIMEGDSTTLETYRGLYYLDLQGVSVGEKKLQIDPLVFKRGLMGQGGVFIDSGTTLTFLKEEGYVPLQNEVESLMAGKLNRVSHPEFFCYAGSVERDLTGFPVVTLQFSGGAQLGLDTNSMFFQLTADVLCMAILASLLLLIAFQSASNHCLRCQSLAISTTALEASSLLCPVFRSCSMLLTAPIAVMIDGPSALNLFLSHPLAQILNIFVLDLFAIMTRS